MKNNIAALGIVLMLSLSLLAEKKAGKISAADIAKRQAAVQNTTIIAGQSVGLIRLGMGMDEANSILGTPDIINTYPDQTWWQYTSINLSIRFDSGAAPTIKAIRACAFVAKRTRMKDVYWTKNVEKPIVNYSTNTGVTLGSTSFAAVRAYAGNSYRDNTFEIIFFGLGLTLLVSADHIVYTIEVFAPQSTVP